MGVVVCVAAVLALGVQAARGNSVVDVQSQSTTRHNAALDDAFYRCLDVQARSLVSPDEPVLLSTDLANLTAFADLVTLIKAIGSWIDLAPARAQAKAVLSLRDGVTDRPACLDTVVVAAVPGPGGRTTVLIGHGASVPGHGPPPPPPL